MRTSFVNPAVPPGYRLRVALFLLVLLCAIALTGCGEADAPKPRMAGTAALADGMYLAAVRPESGNFPQRRIGVTDGTATRP